MPIAFPPPLLGPYYNQPAVLFKKSFTIVPAPNIACPGVPFAQRGIGCTLAPGIPLTKARPNVRNLGVTYQAPTSHYIVNPVNTPITNDRVFDRVTGSLNLTLSGVSRDSTGAALGNCIVLIFRWEDRSFVGETVSDGSGVWSFPLLEGGPFFLVEYKTGGVGTADVAGVSVNTLVPT